MKQIYVAIFIAFIIYGAKAQKSVDFISDNLYDNPYGFENNRQAEMPNRYFDKRGEKSTSFRAKQSTQSHLVNGINYNILSEDAKTVELTYLGDFLGVRYVGSINVPDRIIIGNSIYTVTAIGDQAFDYCRDLTSIVLPNTITHIGYASFYFCDKLTTITLPPSLINIGSYAFEKCHGFTTITIPDKVEKIEKLAFYDNQNLQTINLPASLTTLAEDAISFCPKLTAINVAAGNINFSSTAGVLFNANKSTLIAFPNSKSTTYTVPQTVTSIGNFAFAGCDNLTAIVLPSSLQSIGNTSLYKCTKLTSINIPALVSTIGEYAFNYSTLLAEITVSAGNANFSSVDGVLFNAAKTNLVAYPNNKSANYIVPQTVTSIGYAAFSGCDKLVSILLPPSLLSIGNESFTGCIKLTTINWPSSLQTIGEFAFQSCSSLTSVFLSESLTSIGKYAFSICPNLVSVNWPSTVSTINEGMFWRTTKLFTFDVPATVTIIDRAAFLNTKGLTSITVNTNNQFYSSVDGVLYNKNKTTLLNFPISKSTVYNVLQTVDSIGPDGFRYCKDLTDVTLPSSIRSIANVAFDSCVSLKKITIEKTVPPTVFLNTFRNVNIQTCVVKVPTGSISAYQSALYWNQFVNITDENTTATPKVNKSNLKIYSANTTLVIEGVENDQTVQVFSTTGKMTHSLVSNGDKIEIKAKKGQIYFVKTKNEAVKVVI